MNRLAKITVWLFLLPFRLVIIAGALLFMLALTAVGLGNAYIATIIRNIISNFFSFRCSKLDVARLKHTHILGATGCG